MFIRDNDVFTPEFTQEIKEFREAIQFMSQKELEILLRRQIEYVKWLRWKLANKTKNPHYYITLKDECYLHDMGDIYESDTCEGCPLAEQCEKLRRAYDELY